MIASDKGDVVESPTTTLSVKDVTYGSGFILVDRKNEKVLLGKNNTYEAIDFSYQLGHAIKNESKNESVTDVINKAEPNRMSTKELTTLSGLHLFPQTRKSCLTASFLQNLKSQQI